MSADSKSPEAPQVLQGKRISFRLRSVFVPEPYELAYQLHANDILQGYVAGLTDSGDNAGAYVVVTLAGVRDAVIVPVSEILGYSE